MPKLVENGGQNRHELAIKQGFTDTPTQEISGTP
jgi:hypothetical protein